MKFKIRLEENKYIKELKVIRADIKVFEKIAQGLKSDLPKFISASSLGASIKIPYDIVEKKLSELLKAYDDLDKEVADSIRLNQMDF